MVIFTSTSRCHGTVLEKFIVSAAFFVHLQNWQQGGTSTHPLRPQPRDLGENLSVVATDYQCHDIGYCEDRYVTICQPVHGFIYLNRIGMTDTIDVICNPCTDQRITLPKVGEKNSDSRKFFGYDPIGKQFKVLCRTQRTSRVRYKVLSLGERSWRKIECSFRHYPKKENNNGICINGVIYYIASINKSYSSIVWFDVRSEKFSFTEIEKARPLTLINYKGKLGVLLCFDYRSSLAEVWVLDDTKKVKWSKYTIVLPKSALQDHVENLMFL